MNDLNASPIQTRRWPWFCVATMLFIVYACELFRTAWVGDDAYITLRTVVNFIHGFGLRWNVTERVQSYTHPLWMFVLSAGYFLTREEFYTTIAISMALSLGTFVLLLAGLARNLQELLLAGICLIASKWFVDYSTSGLENPLTHLIFVIYFLIYLREYQQHRNSRLYVLALLAGLGMLNRMDTALIFGPPLAWAWWRCRSLKTLLIAAAGFIPLALWECFSLFYYGFPFPNTAYAKLSGAVPLMLKLRSWVHYSYFSVFADPQTFVAMGAGLLYTIRQRNRMLMPFVAGAVLYLLYILKLGGDFMAGRFYVLPMLVAICLLLRTGFGMQPKRLMILLGTVIFFGLVMPLSPLKSGPDYHEKHKWFGKFKGIADERGFYHEFAGLETSFGREYILDHFFAQYARSLKDRSEGRFTVTDLGSVGYAGFILGPDFHLVDHYGLCDAIMSRTHVIDLVYWRPGHSMRAIPGGYLETLYRGKNVIEDPGVAQYYEVLSDVIRDPLLSDGRLRKIFEFNTGHYDSLLDHYQQQLLEYREYEETHDVNPVLKLQREHLQFRAMWDDSVTTRHIEAGEYFMP